MAQRGKIIDLLNHYVPLDDHDRIQRDQILAFVEKNPHCCERWHDKGHLTGSAWLVDQTGSKVLLTHHKKLGKWLQLGGHADGDPNIIEVARKEIEEESGLKDFRLLSPEIFDLDIHTIAPTSNEPAHRHYDLRFLFQTTGNETYALSAESNNLAWVDLEHLEQLTLEPSLLRMKKKWLMQKARMAS